MHLVLRSGPIIFITAYLFDYVDKTMLYLSMGQFRIIRIVYMIWSISYGQLLGFHRENIGIKVSNILIYK